MLEFIFHGTGTSSAVPNVSCLTSTTSPRCPTCWNTTLDGSRNRRRNTGALIKVHRETPSSPSTLKEGNATNPEQLDAKDASKTEVNEGDGVIVIDCGKTFWNAAVDLFPKYGLREIEAVVITHAHADAMNGLDDLRGWTLKAQIQPYINVYLSRYTFLEVKRCFPYLVAKEFATGGGDVPEFRYHFIEEGIPFEVKKDVWITPVAVEHGRFFSTPTPIPPLPSQNLQEDLLHPIPAHLHHAPGQAPQSEPTPSDTPIVTPAEAANAPAIVPYMAYGFVIDEISPRIMTPTLGAGGSEGLRPEDVTRIVYLSDASHIPNKAWNILTRPLVLPSAVSQPLSRDSSNKSLGIGSQLLNKLHISSSKPHSDHSTPPSPTKDDGEPSIIPAVVVVDCLRPTEHSSHFGLANAYKTVRRLQYSSPPPSSSSTQPIRRAYMVGFGHETTMAEWSAIGDILSGEAVASSFNATQMNESDGNWKMKDGGIRSEYLEDGIDALGEAVPSLKNGEVVDGERVWMKPAWDGLRLLLKGGSIVDQE